MLEITFPLVTPCWILSVESSPTPLEMTANQDRESGTSKHLGEEIRFRSPILSLESSRYTHFTRTFEKGRISTD